MPTTLPGGAGTPTWQHRLHLGHGSGLGREAEAVYQGSEHPSGTARSRAALTALCVRKCRFCIAVTLCSPECLYKPSATSFCPAGGSTRTGKDDPSAVSGSTLLPFAAPACITLPSSPAGEGSSTLGTTEEGLSFAALKSKASARGGFGAQLCSHSSSPSWETEGLCHMLLCCSVLRTGDKSFHKPAHKNR